MAFTINKFLEQPARGTDVGTWDTPVNNNSGIIDNALGGVASIALTNSNVALSSAQYQCAFITLTGAISANIAVTLPAVGSFYSVQNLTSNASAFYVTMATTASGGQVIGIPPGEVVDIMTDGTNVKFRNLGRVGKLEDWANSSNPAWNTACTVPPYLLANGTTFSSATYPVLAVVYGGTQLPDSRGRFRVALNNGTGRITNAGCGINGDTLNASGGAETQLITTSYLPASPLAVSGTVSLSNIMQLTGGLVTVPFGSDRQMYPSASIGTVSAPSISGVTANMGSGLSFPIIGPTYVGGITVVRAG